MKTVNKRLKCQCGFSLLEVMIALALTSIIVAVVMDTYVTQHKNYLAQDDIATVQQSARAVMRDMAPNIRMAGNGLPHGIDAIHASNSDPDTIIITYRVDDCETFLSSAMDDPASHLECGSSVSCFFEGQWVYLFHPDSGGGELLQLSAVDETSQTLQTSSALSSAYDADAIVMSIEQVTYYIDQMTTPSNPRLMRATPGAGMQVFADNITDLQFRYRLDNGMVVDVPLLVENVREVLFTVTGRSSSPDPESSDTDPYRYRTYSSSVHLRNFGL